MYATATTVTTAPAEALVSGVHGTFQIAAIMLAIAAIIVFALWRSQSKS